ncbi:MAG: hypothetical protein WCK18_09295 [Prolixibacteraceae bacterium]
MYFISGQIHVTAGKYFGVRGKYLLSNRQIFIKEKIIYSVPNAGSYPTFRGNNRSQPGRFCKKQNQIFFRRYYYLRWNFCCRYHSSGRAQQYLFESQNGIFSTWLAGAEQMERGFQIDKLKKSLLELKEEAFNKN